MRVVRVRGTCVPTFRKRSRVLWFPGGDALGSTNTCAVTGPPSAAGNRCGADQRPTLCINPHVVHNSCRPADTRARCEADLAALERSIVKKEEELEGVQQRLTAARGEQQRLRGELAGAERRLQVGTESSLVCVDDEVCRAAKPMHGSPSLQPPRLLLPAHTYGLLAPKTASPSLSLQALYDKSGRSAQVGTTDGWVAEQLCDAGCQGGAASRVAPPILTHLLLPASTPLHPPSTSLPTSPTLSCPSPQFNTTAERDEWVRKEVAQLQRTQAQKEENRRGAAAALQAVQAEADEVHGARGDRGGVRGGHRGWRCGARHRCRLCRSGTASTEGSCRTLQPTPTRLPLRSLPCQLDARVAEVRELLQERDEGATRALQASESLLAQRNELLNTQRDLFLGQAELDGWVGVGVGGWVPGGGQAGVGDVASCPLVRCSCLPDPTSSCVQKGARPARCPARCCSHLLLLAWWSLLPSHSPHPLRPPPFLFAARSGSWRMTCTPVSACSRAWAATSPAVSTPSSA